VLRVVLSGACIKEATRYLRIPGGIIPGGINGGPPGAGGNGGAAEVDVSTKAIFFLENDIRNPGDGPLND